MIAIENRQGAIVRRSRNLRGIIAHLGQHGANEVHIWRELNGNGRYQFHFGNGDTTRGEFADFAVLCGWVMSRRNMRGADLYINGQRSGQVNPRHTFLSKHAAQG